VVFLHGIGQSKNFVDDDFQGTTIATPFLRAGFAFATFDQYTRGERKFKDQSKWQEFNSFRLRPAYTVNDTRRFLDYLETLPEISSTRFYLAGASYGAITGATVAAFDKRFQAVALCYGGGNMAKLMTASAIREETQKMNLPMPLVQLFSWYFLSAADPVKYAGDIAPRPVLLQNGTNDSLIAADAARALQDAVKDPKKIKWYEGDHIGTDPPTVLTVVNDILQFFQEQEKKRLKMPAAA
jgi:dienelactone hydrolase